MLPQWPAVHSTSIAPVASGPQHQYSPSGQRPTAPVLPQWPAVNSTSATPVASDQQHQYSPSGQRSTAPVLPQWPAVNSTSATPVASGQQHQCCPSGQWSTAPVLPQWPVVHSTSVVPVASGPQHQYCPSDQRSTAPVLPQWPAVHSTSVAPVASGPQHQCCPGGQRSTAPVFPQWPMVLVQVQQGTCQLRAIPTPLTHHPSRHCSSSQKKFFSDSLSYTNGELRTWSDSESQRVIQWHDLSALSEDRVLLCNHGGDCCQFSSNLLPLRPGSLRQTQGKVGGHCFSPHEAVPF